MSTASIATTIAVGTAVTGAAVYGYCAYKIRLWPFRAQDNLHPPGTPDPSGILTPIHALTSWRTAGLNDRDTLARYLDRGVVRYFGDTPPAGARQIPLVIRGTPTHLTTTATTGGGYQMPFMADYLAAIRAGLASAGRGDEDARCAMLLYAEESGWDRAVWNWNIGNIKSGTTLWAPSRQWVLDNLQFYSTAQYGSGVYLLTDLVHSLDAYYAYASPGEYMTREKYLFEGTAWGRQNYAGVLDGYRAGGLDGLLQSSRALGRGGYSGATATARELVAHYYWNRCQRVMGANFVR